MIKILIMGLPGSGKTTLAKELLNILNAERLNADQVRQKYKDWDFSRKGVLRQAKRMRDIAKKSKKKIVIADFICPYEQGRKIFNPDFIVWMNTVRVGRISTFNKTFEKPKKYNFLVKRKAAKIYSKKIAIKILKKL